MACKAKQEKRSFLSLFQGKPQTTASEVLTRFYAAYNAGDLDGLRELLAEDVEYHDMAVFDEPFVGREAALSFFAQCISTLPKGVKFVVDDVAGDERACGSLWHLEKDGEAFPFSRGCSFHTVNDRGQIVTARDLVESPVKPNSIAALSILNLVAPFIGNKNDKETKLDLSPALFWLFYLGYSGYVLLGDQAPGVPATQIAPEDLQEVLNLSLNYFYVNIGLSNLGLTFVPSVPSHPVYEGLFNFINAWSLMFVPLILSDKRSRDVKFKEAWVVAIQFLTNVFFIPFLAIRSQQPALNEKNEPSSVAPLPFFARGIGLTSLAVGAFSFGWALWAREEVGGLDERLEYFKLMLSTDRVFWAFIIDSFLYSFWQYFLLKDRKATQVELFVPFFGLALHLVRNSKDEN